MTKENKSKLENKLDHSNTTQAEPNQVQNQFHSASKKGGRKSEASNCGTYLTAKYTIPIRHMGKIYEK